MIKKVETEQELADAYHIREVVFIDEQEVPKELEMDEFDATATHLILYQGKQPVATARFREYGHQLAKIERVAVLKELRGKGLGQKIMRFVEEEAAKQGYQRFRLNAQRHAEHFYAQLGYITISEPFDEAGIEHVTMEKEKGN